MVLIRFSDMENQRSEILEENYQNICSLLCQINLPKEKLEFIKSKFKDSISSLRRYENINDMKELLKILEKRCVIGYDNIVKLYDIAEVVDTSSLKELGILLNNQSHWLSKNPAKPINLAFYEDKQVSAITPEFSLPINVMECISSDIKRWQNFARALQIIQEKEIDKIEEYGGNRTRRSLEVFIREVNRRGLSNPFSTLLNALELIKRRDTKEKVEMMLISKFRS